jgi:hypothetical protein
MHKFAHNCVQSHIGATGSRILRPSKHDRHFPKVRLTNLRTNDAIELDSEVLPVVPTSTYLQRVIQLNPSRHPGERFASPGMLFGGKAEPMKD